MPQLRKMFKNHEKFDICPIISLMTTAHVETLRGLAGELGFTFNNLGLNDDKISFYLVEHEDVNHIVNARFPDGVRPAVACGYGRRSETGAPIFVKFLIDRTPLLPLSDEMQSIIFNFLLVHEAGEFELLELPAANEEVIQEVARMTRDENEITELDVSQYDRIKHAEAIVKDSIAIVFFSGMQQATLSIIFTWLRENAPNNPIENSIREQIVRSSPLKRT
jgi:hypothetical protein